ncbi:hypothetical protein BD770DRAFT_303156, partial [Pilaira anomala]
ENTLKKINIASRAYFVPSGEQKGYEYVYFPCRARISRKAQRKNLKVLGAQNGRILDIHYPSGNVVALLVHKSYTQEIQKALQGAGITHIKNYDPTSSNIISNPELQHLSEEEKINLAKEKYNQRLMRALPFIRNDYTKKSVANFFFSQQLITKDQLDTFLNT